MSSFPVSITDALEEYEELGFDTFPLRPGTKDQPLMRSWQYRDPYRMWLIAPEDPNIALRGGGYRDKHDA